MDLGPQYERAKAALLNDPGICSANRILFAQFFEYQEHKLKRRNGLARLDDHCFHTLLAYVTRLRTVNRWFNNKPWKQLTRRDVKTVYDDLEEDRILTLRGHPIRDRRTYYTKILRGKPFELAGKGKLVREVMEFYHPGPKEDVRFISEATFRELIEATIQPVHRLFLWMCFDIGENATSILKLRSSDCARRISEDTNEPEYLVHLRLETLKRRRRTRRELTNYPETVKLLDEILGQRKAEALIFDFEVRQAAKVLQRAARVTGARCIPGGQVVTLKDLRSSMACDLLSKGWTTDEVNARLGHTPSSRELDRYINFLAIDRRRPKQKVQEFQVKRLLEEVEQFRQRERLHTQRQERLTGDHDALLARTAELEAQLARVNQRMFVEGQRLVGSSRPRPATRRSKRRQA